VLGFAVILGACTDNHPESGQRTPAPLSIVVTRDDSSLPAGCRVREVADFISGFFDAFNRGDRTQLARFFPAYFSWYAVTDEKGIVTFSKRDDLLAYFADRHKHHERLRLLKIRISAPSWHGGGDIVFLLTRQADDLTAVSQNPQILGKGALRCKERTIFVWAMGPGGAFAECPEPAQLPNDAVLACAR